MHTLEFTIKALIILHANKDSSHIYMLSLATNICNWFHVSLVYVMKIHVNHSEIDECTYSYIVTCVCLCNCDT